MSISYVLYIQSSYCRVKNKACFIDVVSLKYRMSWFAALQGLYRFSLITCTFTLQELYSLHNGDSTDGISTGCEKYLIHLLVAEPALSVELFKFLPCSDIIYQCNNIMIDALQLSFDNKVSTTRDYRYYLVSGTAALATIFHHNLLSIC